MPDWLSTPSARANDNSGAGLAVRVEAHMIRLDDLAGPSETMKAAGLTNRGSLAYAMLHRGFPEPVKRLRGIRLWDLRAVKDWARANRAERTEP